MKGSERVQRVGIVKLLGRVWIPVVIVLVIGAGGYAVSMVSALGSEKRASYAEGEARGTKSLRQKQLVYEVFGPAGTVADISYFDVDSAPRQVEGASLPWSLTITSDSPAVIGSVVAQGDSESIGCRIVVDGETKAEKVTDEVNAFTYCLVQGA